MRAAKIVRSSSQRRNISIMHRLGQNIGTFAITSVPMAAVCILALSQLKTFSNLGHGAGRCKYLVDAHLFSKLETLAGVGAITWVLRMLLDPVFNFLSDTKFRQFIVRRSDVAGAEKAPSVRTVASVV
uniref:Uncharacterized protein n=1 Tax=Plectus sambesii TaxID=2011161 RepID=A0A914V907_9BILA